MPIPRTLLFVGLVAGILLTAYGLSDQPDRVREGDVVAVVNGAPIGRDLYERVVAGVEADQGALSPEDRAHVLERMIEEELLVQQAVSLGMASRDRMARGYLVQAMMDFVGQRAPADPPGDDGLREFYAEHQARFRRPGRIALETMSFDVVPGASDEAVRAKAVAARQALGAGGAWAVVARDMADEPIVKVPSSPLSAANVLEYLGPTATREAFALQAGALSEPIRTKTGYLLIRVTQRWDDTVPPFETVRDEVVAEWKTKHATDALREYVDELRAGADIEVAGRP